MVHHCSIYSSLPHYLPPPDAIHSVSTYFEICLGGINSYKYEELCISFYVLSPPSRGIRKDTPPPETLRRDNT